MFFFIVMGLFLAAIAFFHYTQGFFSAALSAIFAVVAAVVAFSYHETLVETFLAGKVADSAHALILLALFGAVYLLLRTVFDAVVPGNVTVPSGIDKAGATVMGIIAGIFGTGIMTIAAQELSFGPSIFGYARYEVQDDRQVTATTTGRALDRTEYNELTHSEPGKFGDDPHGHGLPIFPVDNIVVGAVEKLSNGALSAGKPLNAIHPDFLDELFGQRMGIEGGAKRVAMNLPDKKLLAMEVVGLYTRNIPATAAAQKDAEQPSLHSGNGLKPVGVTPAETFLVVRVTFKLQAADSKDHVFRLSPGSARLVVKNPQQGAGADEYMNLYPIGTLQNAAMLFLNKPDDFLFVPVGDQERGVDLVYKVNKKQFESKAPPGTFIEVKRLARVDLSGKEINPGPKPDADHNPMRKPFILNPAPVEAPPPAAPAASPEATPPPAPAADATSPPPTPPTPAPAPAPEVAATFQIQEAVPSDVLPVEISAPAGPEGALVQVPGGTAVIVGGKVKVANLDSTRAEQNQSQKLRQFVVPAGDTMMQVSGAPAANAPWGFANEPEAYELLDSANKKYQPFGVFALYDAKGAERMYLRYVVDSTIGGSPPPEGAGKPKRIVLFYLVPPGTTFTEFDDHGKKAHDVSVTAK